MIRRTGHVGVAISDRRAAVRPDQGDVGNLADGGFIQWYDEIRGHDRVVEVHASPDVQGLYGGAVDAIRTGDDEADFLIVATQLQGDIDADRVQ